MICGIARIRSSKICVDRGSCRASVAVTYSWSGNPAWAGSSCALMIRITPDSFSQRTRCSVAAGLSPTIRASSTLVRSASTCSASRSFTSTSSSWIAMALNKISVSLPTGKFPGCDQQTVHMTQNRRNALAALAAAGLLWGTTVPLSKVALGWLSPGWLTLARFAVAAAILAVVTRSRLRAACTPAILLSGAIGYGGTVLLQKAGITRTSVSHAALLIGSVPVMVAVVAALWHGAVARPVAWAGFGVSLAGVALLASSGGAGAALSGDLLVLVSLLVSAGFTVAQDRLL